jgi:uncharacterized membrane protein
VSGVVIVILVTVGITLLVLLTFFALGFRAGGRHYQSKLQRARFEAARAERQLHNLTRQAFISMSEHAYDQKRRSS